MKIAVAGASGLIGTALLPALRADGHEVVQLVRRTPRTTEEHRWDPQHRRSANGLRLAVAAWNNGAPAAGTAYVSYRSSALRKNAASPEG